MFFLALLMFILAGRYLTLNPEVYFPEEKAVYIAPHHRLIDSYYRGDADRDHWSVSILTQNHYKEIYSSASLDGKNISQRGCLR